MQRNGVIDGLRGLSILCVVCGHLAGNRYSEMLGSAPFRTLLAGDTVSPLLLLQNIGVRLTAPLGQLGVDIFFVISGYLITSLLLHEERSRGVISIAAFYARRICRIIPAFYVFLLATLLLTTTQLITVTDAQLAQAATFLCNTSLGNCGWWVGHTWSLSVEEQFYLVWPLLFAMTPAGARSAILTALLGIMMIVSATQAWATGGTNSGLGFACITAGALYATSEQARAWCDGVATATIVNLAALMLLIQPFFASVQVAIRIYAMLTPLLIALIFCGTLNGRGMVRGLVAQDWLRRIGLISYSLYLWQQIFTGPIHAGSPVLAWSVLVLPCAVLSYIAIERPMIEVGRTVSGRLLAAREPTKKVTA